jgi:tetratricopeptide (TPR) repeat protein
VAPLLLAAASGAAAPAGPAAGLGRQCLDLAGDDGVAACRRALAGPLPAAQAASLRRVLAIKLAGLRRWDDVVAVYRDAARARPADDDAQERLGHALLHLAGRPEEAMGPLQEAIRLRPDRASAHAELGVALAALGRASEAVAAFEQAGRLDPGYFESRPAAQATLDAARRGQRWP